LTITHNHCNKVHNFKQGEYNGLFSINQLIWTDETYKLSYLD